MYVHTCVCSPIVAGVLKEADNMREFYKNERFQNKENQWPSYQPEHFTSVALIHHKNKHTTEPEVEAVASRAHRGHVEVDVNSHFTMNREVIAVAPRTCTEHIDSDGSAQNTSDSTSTTNKISSAEYFAGCQTTKNITKIFKYTSSHKSRNVILIEGAPGIGKTILSKEIAYQWANQNLLADKKLLFLIFLHHPDIKHITCLEEFIACNSFK